MLVLPPSLMTIASSFATSDIVAAWTIAATHTDISANGILSATTATDTAFLQFEPTSSSILALLDNSSAEQEILASIHNLDDALTLASDTVSKVFEILASAKNSDFEPIFDNPFALISTIALVTGTDMIPSVPFQPLAMSLGAKYGACAFPVCVAGQTLAAVLAFQSSRKVSDSKEVQKVLESLGEEGQVGLHKFNTESLLGDGDSDKSETAKSAFEKERTVFFALVGLRQLPFFPFNYLLGAATDVGLRPFVLATILTCMFSNAVSILMGMGGAELFMNTAMR
eukprot:CAMPEP_0116086026 /NCGR_PEP_ID=MMETSP0327-20121206/4633_1 /TAXON_ID=44447 /ORGANISM="Pseudo-nitzschia delicatissima, Strain B596" /LENGTH=283 /DNA_ID=CAMNT_0003577045 /DNA_START=27 /DNA_END=878 /DNA_ORIENTATION=-